MLDAVEIETGPQPTGTVLWLHGLGADGHDFEPVVPALVNPGDRALRFIFPHAPIRPVTINGGMRMRAWYDILGLDLTARQDEAGIRASDTAIQALIERENERGIPTDRIVLAGFSQGGAMSVFTGLRYRQTLAGIMGLSCYLVLKHLLVAERSTANQATPVFLGHGTEDPIVDLQRGLEARGQLEAGGYRLEWHDYPMPHSVCPQEVADIAQWLRKVL